jgi:gas vesicle protein
MSSTKFILGALVGAVVGVQIGILIAPDKGENTRKKLSQKSGEYLDEATGKLNQFFEGLTQKISEVSGEVEKLSKNAKSEVNKINR